MKNLLDTTPIADWTGRKTKPVVISGPCSAESESQVLSTAKAIADIDSSIVFRAGIWKPRTRPNAFEGIGTEGLQWLQSVKKETGMKVTTEVANAKHVEDCLKHGVDILWIGARTTVSPFAVQEIADALQGVDIPVMIKNPVNPDLQLWIGAIERIYQAGIKKIAAIHRGFHSFEQTPFRNIPSWEIAVELKLTFPSLSIICDPSHICGNTELIPYISQKAMDMEMDGLMVETHITPSIAKSDAKQQLTPAELQQMLLRLVIREHVSLNKEFIDQLAQLRSNINKADDEILQLLMKRMKIAREIGKYKRDNNVTILQATRWEEIMKDRVANGKMMGLSEEMVRKLYHLIHEESIRIQTEIMNK